MLEFDESLLNVAIRIMIVGVGDSTGYAVDAIMKEAWVDDSVELMTIKVDNFSTCPRLEADLIFLICDSTGDRAIDDTSKIAEVARNNGAFVVCILSYPAILSDHNILSKVEKSVKKLEKSVDSLIVLSSIRIPASTSRIVRVWLSMLIQKDWSDIGFMELRCVSRESGLTMVGVGEAEGKQRAKKVAGQVVGTGLLEEVDISSAKGVLLNIFASRSMRSATDYDEISRIIHEKFQDDTNIMIGVHIDEDLVESLRVTAIFTGLPTHSPACFDGEY